MTEIMGILNLTPDSFSGDGQLGKESAALLARVDALIAGGASIIDVGAESTRPGAMPLSAEEEWQRIEPFLPAVTACKAKVDFSIDTYHPETVKRAIAAGFTWVNDVGGAADPAMLRIVAASDVRFVLMHSLGLPADKTRVLQGDAVAQVLEWGHRMLEGCMKAGIARGRIVLDPGIGFGKTAEQSHALIRQVETFKAWGVRVLVGHSRKSFLGGHVGERDEATLAISKELIKKGIDYIRVHDVTAHCLLLQEMKSSA